MLWFIMIITQTVDIPESHQLTIDVPREVPTGPVILTFTPASMSENIAEPNCPLCAKYCNSETGEPNFNAETVAAIEEGRAMMYGEIPAQHFNSIEELLADLRS